jgi:hypothetical protein
LELVKLEADNEKAITWTEANITPVYVGTGHQYQFNVETMYRKGINLQKVNWMGADWEEGPLDIETKLFSTLIIMK